ncbi:hypothetical protein D3C74_413380 [compost metagenome]
MPCFGNLYRLTATFSRFFRLEGTNIFKKEVEYDESLDKNSKHGNSCRSIISWRSSRRAVDGS